MSARQYGLGLMLIALVYLHNALPYLTMLPRVNVDEPWLMERAYQVMQTGVPSQPMLGLKTAYLLQVGYGYLLAPWMALFGVGLFQARLFNVVLGLGTILLAASIGRRTTGYVCGLSAALFLALDSNFLGGARNARTDIPSVFFATAALAAYLAGRERSRGIWFAVSGASLGIAMLVHGNAFWVAAILLVWYLMDYGRRALSVPFGYWFLGGVLITFGPYLAVVLARWHDVQVQIGNFAGGRVPAWRPSVVLHQAALELQRYRGWYFGLVTNAVPNPLLWAFQIATVAGIVALVVRSAMRANSTDRADADPLAARRLLILALGAALIFACFINNKVPVYMPHLLIGFALAGGFAVGEAASLVPPRWTMIVPVLLAAYGAAGLAYYEKWYSSAGKSELVAYENTVETLRALVPPGPKYVYASPQFWTPFHDAADTAFFSYAAAQPIDAGPTAVLAGADAARPIVLIIDELQWLPELTAGVSQPTTSWQRDWIRFIERRCVLDAAALGTAHGTIAVFRCGLRAAPGPATGRLVRFVGGAVEYQVGERVLAEHADELERWTRWNDPRRVAAQHPEVGSAPGGLRISGTGWPGIVKMFEASPGDRYLVRTETSNTHDGDLLYLGTWQQPQVRSLSGAASSGIPAPLVAQTWFPRERAFIATAPRVQVLLYSEAPSTDFTIASLEVFRLSPVARSGRAQ
jgi:4-amino-4-deoxy-L-arabinose transferase-like glycosyltransferase